MSSPAMQSFALPMSEPDPEPEVTLVEEEEAAEEL